MTEKTKWLTILACFVILILAAGAGAFKHEAAGGKIETAADLNGAGMGGVAGRMPASSSLIFFKSLTGAKLAGYTAYGSMDESLCALKSGSVDVIWTTDVTADYLLKKDDTLARLDTKGMAAVENTDAPRFSFGMAAKDTKEGRELIEKINQAITFMRDDGILAELTEKYIDNADKAEKFTQKDMVVNDSVHRKFFSSEKALVVGVTGAVPPVDMLDENGKPYGFSVALMDDIGQLIMRSVKFVPLENETAFTALMSGRVDLIFAYGAGQITTETSKNWVMSDGYLDMQKYEFLHLK